MTLRLMLCVLFMAIPSRSMPQEPDEQVFVVHFSTGPAWKEGVAPSAQNGFSEHSTNLQRLRKAGRIQFGARYGDLGMVFFTAESLEAARTELDADPGVEAGIFLYQIEAMRVFYPYKDPSQASSE